MKVEKPRGTRDFLPDEMGKRDCLESEIISVVEHYNYKKVLFPTFEHAELFNLKSGEEIQEHMYVFKDKKSRDLCLRPEATASICRMFAEGLRGMNLPLRLYYSCPMFRYEEPQKGRYREFWQTGIELIGSNTAYADSEVICMAHECLKKIGLDFELEIGHLGILRGLLSDLGIGDEVQDKVINAIDKDNIDAVKELIDEPVVFYLIELEGNKSILDRAGAILENYPTPTKALNELKDILSCLDVMGLDYVVNLGIARGLEYYTGMVFEIRFPELGAQNQICGGGRYDNLIELFSGIKVPAVGFAFGFDRVMDAVEMQGIDIPKDNAIVVVAPVNDNVKKDALKIASRIREEFVVNFDVMDRKLSKILEYAGEINARYTVIVGPKDLEEGKVTVRNMKSGDQKAVKVEEITKFLK